MSGILQEDGGYILQENVDKILSEERNDYALPVTVGEFNLIGITTILKTARKLATSVGEITLSGINAGLCRDYTIVTSVGEFTLTGVSIAFKLLHKLTSIVVNFILTGLTSDLFVSTGIWRKSIPVNTSFTERIKPTTNFTTRTKPTTSFTNRTGVTTIWDEIDEIGALILAEDGSAILAENETFIKIPENVWSN